MEIWKDVKGHEGCYQVSNFGNIKSLERKVKHPKGGLKIIKEKLLNKILDNHGYYNVHLSKENIKKIKRIHVLVAETFLNHVVNRVNVIDHINNNTLDNRVENLQIITQRENAYKNQVSYSSNYKGVFMGCKKYKSKKTGEIKKYKYISSQINIDGKIIRLGTYKTEEDAHLAYQNALKKHGLC
jgi:hypothetical protein